MSDWLEALTPEDREQWDEFVEHFRRDGLHKIAGSAAFVSILSGEWDVKFAVELGAAIMMDKPLLAIVQEGQPVPGKLAAVADVIVAADVDTEEGREKIADALTRFTAKLKDPS